MSKTVVKWALIAIGGITLLVMAVLAVPVQQWRTGEIPQPDLQYSPPPRDTVNTVRLRIDADAACGTGKRRKSDDCLTLLLLCPSTARVGEDTLMPWFAGGPTRLVNPQASLPAPATATPPALYCDRATVRVRVDELFL